MDTVLSKFLTKHFSSYQEVVRVPEASNHFVYKIIDENGNTYFIKQRGYTRSGASQIKLNPKDVRYERDAVKILSSLCPDIFPHIVAEDINNGLIALTDVADSGENLLTRFKAGKVDENLIAKIGETVGLIHLKTSGARKTIRGRKEKDFFAGIVKSRLMAHGNNITEEVVKELLQEPKQLIIGALTTKNILVRDNQISICDLETVCQGSCLFDIGFCMGHVLVHTIGQSKQVESFLKAFQAGYNQVLLTDFSTDLIKKIILATVLYRINNLAAPYELELSKELKTIALKRTKKLLAQSRLDWREVVNLV